MAVAPSEDCDDRKAAYDDYLQDENSGPHNPVESDDARTIIDADIASFRTR